MRILMTDEKLCARRVRIIIPRHRNGTAAVIHAGIESVFRKLTDDMERTVCHDVIVRGPALQDIAFHNAAEAKAVIKTAVGQISKGSRRQRCFLRAEGKDHAAAVLHRDGTDRHTLLLKSFVIRAPLFSVFFPLMCTNPFVFFF